MIQHFLIVFVTGMAIGTVLFLIRGWEDSLWPRDVDFTPRMEESYLWRRKVWWATHTLAFIAGAVVLTLLLWGFK